MDFSAFGSNTKKKKGKPKMDFSAFSTKTSTSDLDKRFQERSSASNIEALQKFGFTKEQATESEKKAIKVSAGMTMSPMKNINLPGGYQARAESYYGKEGITTPRGEYDYEALAKRDNVKRTNLFGVLKTEVDHLAPKALGGTESESNLKTVKAKTGFLGLKNIFTPTSKMSDKERQGGTLEMEKKIIDAYQNGQLTQGQALTLIKQLKDRRDNQPTNIIDKLAMNVASKISKIPTQQTQTDYTKLNAEIGNIPNLNIGKTEGTTQQTGYNLSAKRPTETTISAPDEMPLNKMFSDVKRWMYNNVQPYKDIIDNEKNRKGLAYGYAKRYDIPYEEAYKNLDDLLKKNDPTDISNRETFERFLTMSIGVGAFAAPVKVITGLVSYAATDRVVKEALNLAQTIASNKKYNFGDVKNYSDLLPEDANYFSRNVVDLVGFLASAKVSQGINKQISAKAPAIIEKLTKDIITSYKLPEKVYFSPKQVASLFQQGTDAPHSIVTPEESQLIASLGLSGKEYIKAAKTGLTIEVATEKLVTIADKPWWAKIKSLFGIKPFSQTNIVPGGTKQVPTISGLLEGPSGAPVTPQASPVETILKPAGIEVTQTPGEGILKSAGIKVTEPSLDTAKSISLIQEAKKYKSAEEFVKAIENVRYKSVALEKETGYKPYKLSNQEKELLNILNKQKPIDNLKTIEDVNNYFRDIWNKANKPQVDDLTKLAQRYKAEGKSAEEFVNSLDKNRTQSVDNLIKSGYTKEQAELIADRSNNMMDMKSPSIRDIINNPDEYKKQSSGEVEIFRVVPKDGKIENADYVFTSKVSAEKFRDELGYVRGQNTIISKKVDGSNLLQRKGADNGELIYLPKELQTKSQLIDIYNKANKETQKETEKPKVEKKDSFKSWADEMMQEAKRENEGFKDITKEIEDEIMTEIVNEAKSEANMNLEKDIKSLGGLKPYQDGFMKEELSSVPTRIKKTDGIFLDELVGELNGMGYNYEDSNSLLSDLQALEKGAKTKGLKKIPKDRIKDIISTPLKRKNAENKPVKYTTGNIKENSLYKNWKEKLEINLEGETAHNIAVMAEQTARAELFYKDNKDVAIEIAYLKELPPEGILYEKIATTVIRNAIKDGDLKLANDIIRILDAKSTRMGQEISALRGEFDEDDTYTLVNQVLRERRNKLLRVEYKKDGTSNTKQNFERGIKEKAKEINKVINKKASAIQSAQDILDSLLC